MLTELNTEQTRALKTFIAYKSSYRRKYFEMEGLDFDKLTKELTDLGYLKADKRGFLSETIDSQKKRHNGLTSAQYVDKCKRESRAYEQQAFLNAFKKLG
jgi:aminopeptidase N